MNDPEIDVGVKLALRYLQAVHAQDVAGTDDGGKLGGDVIEDYTHHQLDLMGLGLSHLAPIMLSMSADPHAVLIQLHDIVNGVADSE